MVRIIIAFLGTVVVLALLSDAPSRAPVLLAVCLLLIAACVATARSRASVMLGVVAIIVLRVGVMFGLHALRLVHALLR